MRGLDGTKWAPDNGEPNPTIQGWLQAISSTYPTMASYCDSVLHDDYFSWCGLTVGYCMDKAGIAPVFGTSDTGRFLYAAAWLGWGKPVGTPQLGDVVVFDFGGGDHHVTLFEKDNGDGSWSCHGGNQTHAVRLTDFPKSKVMGIRHPTPTPVIGDVSQDTVPAVTKPASQRFASCVALVLRDEGGNDDDPRDPGGRTSRGITQREWNVWRQRHLGLPADVWQAPQDQILAIYHESYWSPLNCDALPAGVDYTVFDYGVNSGINRSAKVLQGFVGVDVDGEIGPKTIAAVVQHDASTLIKQISDERLTFLQGLNAWPTFGRGWTARVQRVRDASLAMVRSPAVGGDVPLSTTQAPGTTTPGIQKAGDTTTTPSVQKPGDTTTTPGVQKPGDTTTIPGVQKPGDTTLNAQDVLQAILAVLLGKQGAGAPTQPGGTLSVQDILQLALNAAVAQKIPTGLPPQAAQAESIIARLGQAADTLTTNAATLAGQTSAGGTTTPQLSPIDKMLGGQALVGLKTPLAIAAYALVWILQSKGINAVGTATGPDATTTGSILTALISAFGALGVTAKFDRAFQGLSTISGFLQKLPALPPPSPPSNAAK
jgi:uncharacterized protein (TIGR02594 family)